MWYLYSLFVMEKDRASYFPTTFSVISDLSQPLTTDNAILLLCVWFVSVYLWVVSTKQKIYPSFIFLH